MSDGDPYNAGMIESIKLAFMHGKKVRIVWRDSLFFKNIQSAPFAAVIAEVKVLA
jgi:hypothetical protein